MIFHVHSRLFFRLSVLAMISVGAHAAPPLLMLDAERIARVGTPAAPAIGGSVESLLEYAKARNPEYASMQHEVTAAEARAAAAGRLPDPRLRVELMELTMAGQQNPTLSPSRTGSSVYTVMQDVPWFGKRGMQHDIAAFEADGAKGRAAGTWAELAERIKSDYARFYTLHQNARLNNEIFDLMAQLEKVAQVRYAGGLAVQADAIRAQVELTNVKNELIALENETRMTQARLNRLLARPANAALAAPDRLRALPTPAKLDPAALEDRVRAHNPQLFTEDARRKAAEKNRDLAYQNRYPDFTFGIAPTQSRNSIRDWALMVEINIPLQQSARRAQEREAEAMLSAARSRSEAMANQVLAELAENLSALDAARRTFDAITHSLLPQAELTFKAALASYETGKVDFATLLDAQRQIRLARQNQITAQAQAQINLAAIERLLGEEL